MDQTKADQYAAWVVEEAGRRDLDPWLFQGLIYVESRWTARVVRYEEDYTCSVGLGQINLRRCEKDKVEQLKDPHENIQRIGEFLEKIHSTCRYNCAGLGWLRAYNPGNKKYVAMVRAAMERSRAAYKAEESHRREVHVGVYAPWLCGYVDRRDGYYGWSFAGVDGSL